MTSLLSRSQMARENLQKAQIANQIRHQVSSIQNLHATWSERKRKVGEVVEKLSWLRIAVAEEPDLQMAQEVLRGLAGDAWTLLSNTDDVQAVSKGDLWTRLLNSAAGMTTKTETVVRQVWALRIEESGVVDSPERIEEQMPKSPANMSTLQDYKQLYERYKVLRTQFSPKSSEDLTALRESALQLQELLQKIDLELPDDVRKFYRGLNCGAGLELLTPTVLSWLKEKDDISRFVVRVRNT